MQVNKGDKFVATWGYDQTQHSVYNVVDVKGKSVFVEGLNGWSNLSEKDLAPTSKVKVYNFTDWLELSEKERNDWTSRGFDHWRYAKHMREKAIEKAETRTIVKMNRVNGESWTYHWILDNGEVVDSTEDYKTRPKVHIVRGVKRCLLQKSNYDQSYNIKIDDVIRAYLDKDYNNNADRYAEQNLYTAHNGR